jgi:ABC-type nitrate/sulfonate/bicarbonate transport system substrate-binding protein
VDVQSGYITDEAVNYQQLTGKFPHTVSYAAVGLPDPSSTFFTTPQFLSAHRALVVGFLRATMKGILANEADPAYGAKITTDKYGKSLNLKYGQQLSMNKLYLPLYENSLTKQHGLLYLSPSYVAGPVYRGYQAAAIKTVPVSQLLDPSLQAQAAKGVKQPS